MTRAAIRFVLCGALMYSMAAGTFAQTSTTTETKKFQVIAVDGNQLVVRLPEGTRELTVPSDFRFTVDGKSLSVHELKPGMTGTATITTKTTAVPVTVTEVKNGTVRRAIGTSIIVETGGEYKQFTQSDIDKRGVKIMRDGRLAQISDFRENDQLTATIVTTMPPRIMTEKEVQATLAKSVAPAGTSASAAGPPASSTPRPAAAPPQSSAATVGAAPRQLPKTAGSWPVLGLAGLASLLVGLGFTVRRRAAKS
jgi:LPXTG-motif cell wall-anchored protein